ncbi:MAG: ribosome small subunit-dependent GTPase A [Eubacteriales bacterium]
MIKGTIIKGIGGFYYIKTEHGIFECKGRGLFRKEKLIPFVGDHILLEPDSLDDYKGTIVEILPRRNIFMRPPVANIDQLLIVMAMERPEPNFYLLDKFLVMAEKNQVEILIAFNKVDLVESEEIDKVEAIYGNIYKVRFFSAKTGLGVATIKDELINKQTAVAGPSGVGKSTLINNFHKDLNLEVGAISVKTQRGKHTTRHVELYELNNGGFVFDTPGFTSFETVDVDLEELHFMFPELHGFSQECRFKSCTHINEPDCAVKLAVEAGKIHKSRYHSYITLYNEIKNQRRF